ncbi:hypothetical protein ACO0QE_003874 [Hanseniaspora vineae]
MSRQISTQSNISLPDMSAQIMNVKVTEEHSLFHVCAALLKRLDQLPALKPYISLSKSTAETACEKQAFLITQNNNNTHNLHNNLNTLNNNNNNNYQSQSKASNSIASPGNGGGTTRNHFENSRSNSHRASSSSSLDSASPTTDSPRMSSSGARFSTTSVNSASSSFTSKNDLLTFSIGVLPVSVDCDPVTQLSKLFQLGSPLCIVFNSVKPQYKLTTVSSDDIKICKKSIYDFICACKVHLAFNDEELFTISDVFSNSINNLMKIIDVVNLLLDSAPKIFPPVSIQRTVSHGVSSVPSFSQPNSPMYDFSQQSSSPHATFQRLRSTDSTKSELPLPSYSREKTSHNNFMSSSLSSVSSPTGPPSTLSKKDDRYGVFREFLETERKYVYDLEILQDFNEQLVDLNIINLDESNMLFPKLHDIIEFQRRFLVSIESNNNVNYDEQRVGSIFVHSQNFFKLYEPWSIGQTAAIDFISSLPVFQSQSSNLIIKNKLELQAFLLKPVQRLCKYPLLLRELIQATPANCANLKELESGLLISKTVAQSINENQRKTENHEVMKALHKRVTNWKGYNIAKFGDLLFFDKVVITNASTNDNGGVSAQLDTNGTQTNKQFEVFLFEKIIVFFTEVSDPSDTKASLSTSSHNDSSTKNSLMKTASSTLNLKKNKNHTTGSSNNTSNSSTAARNSQEPAKLDLRGRIMVPTINKVMELPLHSLMIQWEMPKEHGNFVFKFKNDESKDNWFICLNNLMNQYKFSNDFSSSPSTQSHQSVGSSALNTGKIRSASLSSSTSSLSSPMESSARPTNSTISTASNGSHQRRNSNRSSANNLRLSSSSNQHVKRHQHYNSIISVNSLQHISESSPHSSMVSASRQTTTTSAFESEYRNISENYKHSISENDLLCRVQFHNDFYTILISIDFTFDQVFRAIHRKVGHMGEMQKLKYQDEDGDYVTLQSDEDWDMVKEWLQENNESMLNVIAYN